MVLVELFTAPFLFIITMVKWGTECSKCTLEMAKEQINAQYQDKDNMTCLISLAKD